MPDLIAGIPATEIEQSKIKISDIKCKAFDYLRHFADGTYDTKTSGYKSLEDALIRITKRANDECEKIMQTPERSQPDTRDQGRGGPPMIETIRDWAIKTQTAELITRAIEFNPARLRAAWTVPVIINFRLKSSAGRAGRSETNLAQHLELHPILLRAGRESDLRLTFLHEVGHILQQLEYGFAGLGLGHGPGWWEAMIRLGQRPWKREHRYHALGREMHEARLAAQSGRQDSDLDAEEMGI